MEGGRIVETGSPGALLELGGRYAQMAALQASRLTPETEALHA
jgi:ABC-type multidrug transport system fused ATPase/permease subunit